jgi:ankyrin repeat protein
VEKLVEVGADVNAVNSFGYSCMLEACHRGYIIVAKYLLKGHVDLSYIPDEELASNSPFASAPCQSALAEAARSGFFKVVQTLLDAGAPKDLGNRIGWTALHEACFYNRMDTVKTLLLGGASATVRTRQGALPYHLACIPEIRNMLESMGGPAAVPSPGDTIDMLQILTELTMPSEFSSGE